VEAISGLGADVQAAAPEERNEARLVNKGMNGAGGLEIACALRIGDVERDVSKAAGNGAGCSEAKCGGDC
jgi:hypothetical protein